jgi:hypothetical protein
VPVLVGKDFVVMHKKCTAAGLVKDQGASNPLGDDTPECPFCKRGIPAGATVCTGCKATWGVPPLAAVALVFLGGPALMAILFAGAVLFGSKEELSFDGIWGAVSTIAVGLLVIWGLVKMSRKRWFR